MATVTQHPWTFINRFNRDLDGLLAANTGVSAYNPPVDVREEADRFVVEADLPGIAPSAIEITADKGVLTIKGERQRQTHSTSAGFERIERAAGQFTRRFTLPENAVPQQIKARFNHGVLEISIPKQAEIAAHRITVEAA
jgi:HSP20 family protein